MTCSPLIPKIKIAYALWLWLCDAPGHM
jgi:hypothetical protein